ncbi:MBL fold metallo-hydrolase [Pulveribacter suum]|uniref:MBL fold metallo-hydrolase n=1 Tax=Pulveribacter suum TaxID=2116657 RepID=A0A2P1NN75_9BURK|nr:MBL fold metallo-hydrolase [Pulveribacter suum]AVP58514.1 MBL fold metallo-hydrolase [Pulveribacter suum]
MLRFRNLASGSGGNATLIEARSGAHTRRLLMDCGLSLRQVDVRLAAAGTGAGELDALFITHEHSDHTGCVLKLALRERIPVWMSQGTWEGMGAPPLDGLLRIARDGQPIDLGDFEALPFAVPHDAREPLHLRCSDGATHIGLMTDLGHASDHVLQHLRGCHALLLETNHDADMLHGGHYPAFLKRRIAGPHGHLPNDASADLLHALCHPGLRHVVAAHLSARNNQPHLAQAALAGAWGCADTDIVVADQRTGTGWIEASY